MVGQLKYEPGRKTEVEWGRLYGLPVIRVQTDPNGWLGSTRLRRAGKGFRRSGVVQTLVPEGFEHWTLMERFGLRPVDPLPLLRVQGDRLVLEALRRSGIEERRATVALRGERVDPDMARTARSLCGRVRRVVIEAPRGGYELALQLRREFGIAVIPPEESGQIGVCYGPERGGGEMVRLNLYGPEPDLAGLRLSVPVLKGADREDLHLLAALWQGGQLCKEDVKIT